MENEAEFADESHSEEQQDFDIGEGLGPLEPFFSRRRVPASPCSPDSTVQPRRDAPLSPGQLGEFMAAESAGASEQDSQQSQQPLGKQLEGHVSFATGPGEWHAMNSSMLLARNTTRPMPWERQVRPRISLSSIFQEPLLGRFDGLRRVTFDTPSVSPWAWVPKGTFEARRLLAARFAKSEDSLRLAAFKKIRVIVLFFPDDSELGRNLVSSAGSLVEEAALTSTIEDTFAGRAAGTLFKRASDFSRFAKWIVSNKGRPLAPTEGELYSYMLHLRREKAGATAGESFVKALRFFCHLTGASKAAKVSPRVQGAAKAMTMSKRPLWQAPPLPVEAVRLIEDYVHEQEDPKKAAIAGFILFCLYASSRWSDAARGSDLRLDVAGSGLVLLECSTRHYKTRAKDRRDTVLPLIALGSCLTQPAWGRAWFRRREEAGLSGSHCLMPAMSTGGQFLSRPMTAAEGTLWLREILYVQGFSGDLELYSSHSLKATALSWTAKSGTMTYEERLTQGHHCSPKHGMALLYSRDALAEILTKVARVVSAISRSVLNPDLPRAERIAQALNGCADDYKHLPETAPDDLPGDDPLEENVSEAGTDITNLGDLEDDLGPPAPESVRPRVTRVLTGETFVHILSGVVHKLTSPGVLKCGRKVTANMRPQRPEEAQDVICQQCAA